MARKRTSRSRGRGRKNRRKHEARVAFPSPIAAVIFVVAVLALMFLWFDGRCESLGGDLGKLEKTLEKLEGRVLNEEYKWTNMKSPRNMERLLVKHKLVMTLPDEDEVIRVRALADVTREEPERYAQKAGAYMND
jgi:hypothetical protein